MRGSRRRLSNVSREEYERRWENVFGGQEPYVIDEDGETNTVVGDEVIARIVSAMHGDEVSYHPFRLPTRMEIDPSIPPHMAADIAIREGESVGEVVYHGEDDLWQKRMERARRRS